MHAPLCLPSRKRDVSSKKHSRESSCMVSLLSTFETSEGCISVVHTVIPSGSESRNFYYTLDISTGKLVINCQLSLIFKKQIIESERQKYNITINHKMHILLHAANCGSSLLATSPTVQ